MVKFTVLPALLSALAVIGVSIRASPVATLSEVADNGTFVAQSSARQISLSQQFHPVVIWHGLGDSAYSEPMQAVAKEIRDAFPGIFVHLVNLADSFAADQCAGFFGNVNEQVEQICGQLAEIDELRNGFDAIGFSQGGQFMRAYVQRCNQPHVRNLVTFGSQHMGISDFPACKPGDLLCRLAEGALRGGIYSHYAQNNIVTAQYYRNPRIKKEYDDYLKVNQFIADINNEVEQKEEYKKNIQSLDNLVLLMFDHDATVQPKQSSWFASYPEATEEDAEKVPIEKDVVPLRQSSIYTQDRIGLKTLDKRGALTLELCRGRHMQIDDECSGKVFGRFVGLAPPSKIWPAPLRHTWARIVHLTTGANAAAVPAELQILSTVGLFAMLASLTAALCKSRTNGIRLQ